MERKIPLTFESVILSSPAEQVSENNPNLRRVKVRAFSKYGNRNGSYITDQMAEKLVASAIDQPIVGWYDPQTKSWAGHVGPTLAQAYGYVESFIGWEPFTDTDGVTRDYSVFSVVLFVDYYDAARQIVGSNQSMELNPETIEGDWAQIGEDEYFVFTNAQIFSFCVIGTKEPCFSVSAFFTKNENTTQFEKLKNLVFEMRKIVDECQRGGDTPMENENMNPVVEEVVETPVEEVEAVSNEETVENFEAVEPVEETVTEEEVETEPVAEFEAEIETEETVESVADPEVEVEEPAAEEAVVEEPAQEVNYELLYNELRENFEAAQARIEELENENGSKAAEYAATIAALNEQISAAQARIAGYEHAEFEAVQNRKNDLIAVYEKNLSDDEISEIRATAKNLSYDELESKLAVVFSRKQLHQATEEVKVPLMNTRESEFAVFMAKYKK